MFQPGEEGYHGARFMLGEGLLDAPSQRPTGAYAIHVTPVCGSGTTNHRPGPQMAAQDKLSVVIKGRGGHASAPFLALDPIPIAAEAVIAIQTALTRRLNPFDRAVVTVGRIAGGTTHNIIPETAVLERTIRTFSEKTRSKVHDLLDGVVARRRRSPRCNGGRHHRARLHLAVRLRRRARRPSRPPLRPQRRAQ